jgi:SHS family lactate transporter-like MFS transporter
MGAVYAYVIILTFIGPEYLQRSFAIEHDEDLREVTGRPVGADALMGGQGDVNGKESEEDARRIAKAEA